MKLLIIDYISRWRWLLLVILLATALAAAFGGKLGGALLIVLYFQKDFHQGWKRVVRQLPLTTRQQAFSGWFLSITLVPLMALAVIPLAAWTRHQFAEHPAHMQTWLAPAIAWWLTLGALASGHIALRGVARFAKPVSGTGAPWTKAWALIATTILAFMVLGVIELGYLRIAQVSAVKPWLWAICAAVPFLVTTSAFLATKGSSQSLEVVDLATTRTAPNVEQTALHGAERGLTGLKLLLTAMHGRAVLFLLLGLAVPLMIIMKGSARHSEWTLNFMSEAVPAFGAIGCTLWCGLFNMRMLRILPFSTRSLALLLITVPLVVGLAVGGLFVGGGILWQLPILTGKALSAALAATAMGAVGTFVGLRFSRLQTALLMPVLVPLAILGSAIVMDGSAWSRLVLAVVHVALTVMSYRLVCNGLRRSPQFYRMRPIGTWGQENQRV